MQSQYIPMFLVYIFLYLCNIIFIVDVNVGLYLAGSLCNILLFCINECVIYISL